MALKKLYIVKAPLTRKIKDSRRSRFAVESVVFPNGQDKAKPFWDNSLRGPTASFGERAFINGPSVVPKGT